LLIILLVISIPPLQSGAQSPAEWREGNAIRFVFEYPDGPFHTVFQWSPEKDSWECLMTQKNKDGKWSTFGDFRLTRSPQ